MVLPHDAQTQLAIKCFFHTAMHFDHIRLQKKKFNKSAQKFSLYFAGQKWSLAHASESRGKSKISGEFFKSHGNFYIEYIFF